tara:strand:+ start:88640 stop:90643 length:2004 start_codon:yes stop_codon:yes gene_type:complete
MSPRQPFLMFRIFQSPLAIRILLPILVLLAMMTVLPVEKCAGKPVESEQFTLLPGILTPINLHEHVRWLKDETNDLTLGDVLRIPANEFSPSHGIPSFGYSDDTIWYRLQLSVPKGLNESLHIEIQPSYLNFIDAYLFKRGTNLHQWQSHMGDHVPARQRPTHGSNHIDHFPNLDPGDYTLYIRTQSNSAQLLIAKLWPTEQLVSSLTLRDAGISIYFGTILMLGLVYTLLGRLAGDRTVVTYGICVLLVGTLASSVNGIVLSIIQPEWPYTNDLVVGATNALSAAATIFLWLNILDLGKHNVVIARIVKIYCGFSVACMFTAATDLYAVYGAYVVPMHAAVLASFCVILAYRILRSPREWILWIYFVVIALPTGAAIMLQLTHAGLITATPFGLGLHQYTLLFHICAMGLIMGFRLSRIEKDRLATIKVTAATTSLVGEQRKLISMLSHEFRTPLAVIQRSSEMLMLRLREAGRDVTDRLQRIQDQSRKLSRLVDIFLNKDGIDNSDFALAREMVMVDRLLTDFVSGASRKDAEIILECIGTKRFETYVDITLVSLAITNLIETARRYAHGTPIHMTVRPNNDWLVEIDIPCQGPDLNDDEVQRIKDALFRRDTEAASLQSALGLHISQRIVDAHGGSIKLRDKGTEGVELCLLLPSDEIDEAYIN